MKIEFENLTDQDKDAVKRNLDWMRNEPISPRSVDTKLPDAGDVIITINGSVFKKEEYKKTHGTNS